FQHPAMRVGWSEVYWHRPLVAYLSAETGEPAVLPDAPTGYLTAYRADRPALSRPIELWPRFLEREPHLAGLQLFGRNGHGPPQYAPALNLHNLLDSRQLLGYRPLPRTMARSLLTLPRHDTLDGWLESLPRKASDHGRGHKLVEELVHALEPATKPKEAR